MANTTWTPPTLTLPLTVADGGTGQITAPAAFNALAAMDGLPDVDHTANGPHTSTFAAGAAITVMDLVYLGAAGKWLQTDADVEATANGMLAVSLESKVDAQAMNVALPGSFVRDDTWVWTIGARLYVGLTAGQITETKPSALDDVVRTVGFAVSADVIYFDPSPDYITILV